ncbi:hypothetical protein P171DRAFT_120414 [Karstenula rhodostoma CBS 690.94]|uniref:Uncharacterized protein n=1 Tax=Karstenula rhodostoma CBS 690.94 TaxID=1392251 RepID=A0A9P4P8L6_9PLEO|nr:hypothetical protein P171DRAFT_120414 [Karstenula rhodostoma CBS 690.94]
MRGCSSKPVPSSLRGAGLSVALLRCVSTRIWTSVGISGSDSLGCASCNLASICSLGPFVSLMSAHHRVSLRHVRLVVAAAAAAAAFGGTSEYG